MKLNFCFVVEDRKPAVVTMSATDVQYSGYHESIPPGFHVDVLHQSFQTKSHPDEMMYDPVRQSLSSATVTSDMTPGHMEQHQTDETDVFENIISEAQQNTGILTVVRQSRSRFQCVCFVCVCLNFWHASVVV